MFCPSSSDFFPFCPYLFFLNLFWFPKKLNKKPEQNTRIALQLLITRLKKGLLQPFLLLLSKGSKPVGEEVAPKEVKGSSKKERQPPPFPLLRTGTKSKQLKEEKELLLHPDKNISEQIPDPRPCA